MSGAAPVVAMLLDNHHGVDRRVRLESTLLAARDLRVRVISWDRRSPAERRHDHGGESPVEEIVRVPVPCPPGGGAGSAAAAARFSARVWRSRRRLLAGARVLVAHDLYLLPLGRALAAWSRLPLVYDAHEDFAALERGRYPLPLLRAASAGEIRLARRAQLVVVPSSRRADRWHGHARSCAVLPNVGATRAPLPRRPARWDLVYCGLLSPERRLDVLLEVARRRPDLQVAVGGYGRLASQVEQAARALENLDWVGRVADPDEFLARGRAVYYGQDPAHPYSDIACPNTLHQALRVERPLVFFCGGDVADLAARFRIGARCRPDPDSLLAGVAAVRADEERLEFAAARADVAARTDLASWASAVTALAGTSA